jgi:hypothetical protein
MSGVKTISYMEYPAKNITVPTRNSSLLPVVVGKRKMKGTPANITTSDIIENRVLWFLSANPDDMTAMIPPIMTGQRRRSS